MMIIENYHVQFALSDTDAIYVYSQRSYTRIDRPTLISQKSPQCHRNILLWNLCDLNLIQYLVTDNTWYCSQA